MQLSWQESFGLGVRGVVENPRQALNPRFVFNAIARVIPKSAKREAVSTTIEFEASSEEVWRALMFYEEVPEKPWLLLRLFLPRPVRTEGGKTEIGNLVRCTYDGGHLVKRITAVEHARLIEFEVLEQRLGIDNFVSMGRGSYILRDVGGGLCDVILTTHYRGHLRPRRLWQHFEHFVARELHLHILNGMRASVADSRTR